MKCLILAGGFGIRLYPLSVNKAKAFLEYKGKPLLTHIVDKLPEGVDILISTNRKFETDFRNWQKSIGRQTEICVEEAISDEQKMGAIGSVNFWIANKNITEDLLVIAGDNYFDFDLAEFIAAHDGKNALVAVYDIGDKSKANQFGVVSLRHNCIEEFIEKPAKPKSSLIATAIYILPPRTFPLLSQYCSEGGRDNLGSFITYLVNKDRVHAYSFSELWLDIGSAIKID